MFSHYFFALEATKAQVRNITKERDWMPILSIIVIFHNMRREARRTLYSLNTIYQTNVKSSDYEVIAIDNGSTKPLNSDEICSYGPNFRYHFLQPALFRPWTRSMPGLAWRWVSM